MRRDKKMKVMAIVALCVSILGLTLGFAAFSNTLTISSSATVTPNSSDFKLKLYGIPNHFFGDHIDSDSEEFRYASSYSSTTVAGALTRFNTVAELAVIDNENLSLKNIKATFTEPGDSASYFLLLKNEGKYDAYIDVSSFELPQHICEAGEGATQSLVDSACEKMVYTMQLGHFDESSDRIDWDITNYLDENGNIKIPMNSYVYVNVRIYYGGSLTDVRADGDFSVKWDDVKINFSTVSQ